MKSGFSKKLDFYIQKTGIHTQNIDSSIFKTFGMIITSPLDDKVRKPYFFKKTFLLTGISINVVLQIFFLILNKVKINFIHHEMNYKLYTTIETQSKIKQGDLILIKLFAMANLNLDNESFVVHSAFFTSFNLGINV